jgi:hypothetical protein
VLNSCRELDVAVPGFADDAAAAETARTIGPFREMLDKILGEAKETLQRASDAEAAARKLASEREIVRADLTIAGEEIRKLTTQEYAKATEVATLGAMLQGME